MGSRLEKGSSAVRKRIEQHAFSDETGEEYEASAFGGFDAYYRRKKVKLQNLDADLRASSGSKPQIFKGVVAHVTGYTQPPLHVLHKELVRHGAGFLQYLDSKTMATHIIASALPPKKAVDYGRYRVVKPSWVTDSIKAGKLLPWSDYRVIDESPRQKSLRLEGGKMLSQAAGPSQLRYREQSDNSHYNSRFQKNGMSPDLANKTDTSVGGTRPRPPLARLESIGDTDSLGLRDGASCAEDPVSDHQTPIEAPLVDQEIPGHGAPPAAEDALAGQLDGQLGGDGQVDHHSAAFAAAGRPARVRARAMTSEEHNALLLSDPRIRKSSTANPEFLHQFYSESRLHHLSTWKAELKSKMQRLAAEAGVPSKAAKRKPGSRRYIMHVDFDSFFCAVSLRKYPELADKPAAVAHGTGSGSEIASCNYPARAFGVKNGMWMKRAQELCPRLKVLPYDFPAYEEASQLFYGAILELGGVTQSVSIDEALVDITDMVLSATGPTGLGVDEGSIWREQEKADEIASTLRGRIRERTGCNASVGLGGNILLAKVALRMAKPAGQRQIAPGEALDILGDLKVDDLPGVAYSIGGKLEDAGIKFVRDVRQASKEYLTSVLGPKTGARLWEYSRGIDRAEVGDQPVRKSVSAEVNWGIRFINQQEAEDFVGNLCKELERRVLNEGVKGRQLTVRIMRRSADAPLDPPKHLGHGKCDTFNRTVSFGVATSSGELIAKEAVGILRSYKFSPGDLRGIGVQLTRLEPDRPPAAHPDGSQKRLTFASFAAAPAAKKQKAEAIEEAEHVAEARPGTRGGDDDPITDDPLTPRKPRLHPALALARANEADEEARTPLNMAGTQFIMPSNPDPTVLAELPQSIRSKLTAGARARGPAGLREPSSPSVRPAAPSPAIPDGIPPDVDPEVFSALPDDVKAEVLASYGRRSESSAQPRTTPRKDRAAPRPRKAATTPTKPGGIRGMFDRARERQHGAGARPQRTGPAGPDRAAGGDEAWPATAAAAAAADDDDDDDAESAAGDLDPEFLSELPEDVRREVVADHRRRLAQRSRVGRGAAAPPLCGAPAGGGEDGNARPPGQARLQFPRPPAKVGFTSAALTSPREIREMLGAWHGETRDEGPHTADVEVFEEYLVAVVVDERDLDKARGLVKWLQWVVEDGGGGDGRTGWVEALESIKTAVQEAMRRRGLGPLDLR